MSNQGGDESEIDHYDYVYPADQRWLEEGGPKVKPKTERDHRAITRNTEWRTHIATLVGLWRFDTRSLPDPYKKHNKLYFGPIVRAEIYRIITGIKNYPKLISHFRRSAFQDNRPVHVLLGFEDIPKRSALQKADKRRFTPQSREFISYWARKLARIAITHGFDYPDIQDDYLSNNGGVTEVPVESKRGYAQYVMDLGREFYPLDKADHARYTDPGIYFDFSVYLCDTNGTPQGQLENFADARGLQKGVDVPSAETFRNDVYRLSPPEWEQEINSWTEAALDEVFTDELKDRYLPIAIDTTNIPTWSKDESDLEGVLGTEKLNNTHYAYRILSAQTVSDGMPIQLAHELQMSSEDRVGRLESLLDTIEERGFNIGCIFADSEFASGRTANMLKERGIDFVIQVPTYWVSSIVGNFEGYFGVNPRYTMNKNKSYPDCSTNTLFASRETKLGKQMRPPADDEQKVLLDFFDVAPEYFSGIHTKETVDACFEEEDKKGRWYCFITNLDINEDEARALRDYYRYRWAIETTYRKFKSHFLPTTRSTRLQMRIYLYLFGMFAYNSWVVANVKCRHQNLINARERPPIRASRFNTLSIQRYRPEFGVHLPEP